MVQHYSSSSLQKRNTCIHAYISYPNVTQLIHYSTMRPLAITIRDIVLVTLGGVGGDTGGLNKTSADTKASAVLINSGMGCW